MAANKQPRSRIIEELRQKLQALESSFRSPAGKGDEIVPTGIEPLNAILHHGGFRQGTLVEWLAEEQGSGAATLAFTAALPWLSDGQTCVVVDEKQEFYAASLAALGIGLEQILIVRPPKRDLFWALEQSLMCRGVAVTVGWLGAAPDRILRRLQLAAETGGGIGVLLRPANVREQPTWSHLRLLVSALPSALAKPAGRRARVEVLYCQGGKSDGTVEVEICDETGDVRLVPSLAASSDARQAT